MSIMENIWDYSTAFLVSGIPALSSFNLNSQVYWINQNVAMPTNAPFVTMGIKSTSQMGHDRSMRSSALKFDVDEKVRTLFQTEVIYDIYGKDAYLHALSAISAMRENASLEKLRLAKLGIVSIGPVNDISAVVDTKWDGRANFTVLFSWNYIKKNVVTSVLHAPINGLAIESDIHVDQVVDAEGNFPPLP